MVGRWILLLVALHLSLPADLKKPSCKQGLLWANNKCIDENECEVTNPSTPICGNHADCINTYGSFYCICIEGYSTSQGRNFSATSGLTCRVVVKHKDNKVWDPNAKCQNEGGSYRCSCHPGFGLRSGRLYYTGNQEKCIEICEIDKTICGNGTCHQEPHGHACACHAGFTNYGNKHSRCTAFNCDVFGDTGDLNEAAHDLVRHLNQSCLELTESEDPIVLDGNDLLKRLLSFIDQLLSSGDLKDNRKVSAFLDVVENALKLIGPLLTPPGTNQSFVHTELQLWLHKGADLPQKPQSLSTMHAQLDIQMDAAAGDLASYPGFTAVSLLSYAHLMNGSLSRMAERENENFKINSKVVTVSVSNTNTSHLQEPVMLTLYHQEKLNTSSHTCVFWNSSLEGGMWSDSGCKSVKSNANFTVCSCNHLSSFAVLMALHDIKDKFQLQLITWVGLSLSLICLFICILTFWLIRSIHSTRTTIHLHLCISLFLANIIFLAGISRTENPVGCAVVAGILHFFYLAAFFWMCLEGIQLFRMVVLVFNTSFKPLYMMAFGYGLPAVIVTISAAVNPTGYGTERYCWLKLDFIWSFFGPVCVIILINIFFFLITVWKLAQKFSSLNPDLDNLQKIKAFTITAVAQLCVLGIMWIFGCFQFEEGTIAMSYLFTIFGSLQGVMLFVMHCLFSKQVREEYATILSKCCAPRKKRYSEFSSSSSSKPPASKSHDTGESHI